MEIFVARQPIFNKRKQVLGYELLYRKDARNSYSHLNGDQATLEVIINSFSVIGMDVLTGGKKAFINFTYNLLIKEISAILPPRLVAVEILEDVEPDHDLVEACKKLKQMGYLLVLDDYEVSNEKNSLVDLADIIKVDLLSTSASDRKFLAQEFQGKIKLLAEKVETEFEFEQAVRDGYDYFQGYFFKRPEIMVGHDLPTFKQNYLRIIQDVNRPEADFHRLETIIKQDLSLSYRLLKLINSAAFGLHTNVFSIKYALVLLGVREFKKWVSLIAMRGIGEGKPDELVMTSLVRAKFAESLAPLMDLRTDSSDLFLMGMFSLIDALLDRPLAEILDELPISAVIKDALLGKESRYKKVYNILLAYEAGKWDEAFFYAPGSEMAEQEVAARYLESLRWANQIFF